MAKNAKTASKNSPSQRGKTVDATFNSRPVTKIMFHSRSNGRKSVRGLVAYKDVASRNAPDLFAKVDNKYVSWKQVD